ncbi:aldo/keto reductase [Jiangella aurantiaca]|uniref:Aldo/keto reductase n=1 Tax=Jiangella aurantiaca TaxID=2530373 RepID=A0A4R5A5A8_9ACTN|nr:aldo/keto reductase [Jiangella aurantiaca]TDD66210.1 aldo/keto reductase [Jiangella aurantiaca]
MRYRLLGPTGLRVSELALGTMTFGTDWGWGAPAETCRKILDTYAAAGGNVLDTANNYTDGSSESILGELLAGRRDEFVLATKADSLGAPGVRLPEEALARLDELSRVPRGFPHDFLDSPGIREIVYGDRWRQIDDRRTTGRRTLR